MRNYLEIDVTKLTLIGKIPTIQPWKPEHKEDLQAARNQARLLLDLTIKILLRSPRVKASINAISKRVRDFVGSSMSLFRR